MSRLANQKGFTLIELMLAMALLVTVLMLSTVGFIGINRTYSRGVVRKELSEFSQIITEDITRAIRTGSQSSLPSSCDGTTGDQCPGIGWKALCFTTSRIFWQDTGGLYNDTKACDDSADTNAAKTYYDDRYKTVLLQVEPVTGVRSLFRVKGVLRTADDSAFNIPGSGTNEEKAFGTACKGTAEGNVGSCTIEKFNFVVNARGAE